jgi:thiamine-phosphate pyrophosphorylase
MQNRAAYRIIDANFNRAREAIRVMEDFCRFFLNSSILSGRCKKMRHDLCAAIGMLDSGLLIANRDTISDVGTSIRVEGQLVRKDLKDCATAASKRFTEALRTIAEAVQTIDRSVAEAIESIRYQAYTLEKDIFLASSARDKFKSVRLYVLISADFPTDIVRLTRECCQGGADCIQLRVKNMPDDELLACAKEMVEICRKSNVVSIINDWIDLAVAAGSDGVHLGQNDMPIKDAKKIAASPMIFGISTHNLDELSKAIESSADYVAIGPAFASDTKPNLKVAGPEFVKQATQLAEAAGIPHVTIGGITLSNVEQVLASGAKAIAVSSAIANSSNPLHVCKNFKEKMDVALGIQSQNSCANFK